MSNEKLAEALGFLDRVHRGLISGRISEWPGLREACGVVYAAHAAEAAHPQLAQDASNPLKGWIFDKVNMGRGDERYICTPNGANATTVRNESTSDHRERLLWLIADAMVKESGR